jgi:predicted transcriptional regulator
LAQRFHGLTGLVRDARSFYARFEENAMATDVPAARLGLLKFIVKKGGEIPMRELHTHSLVFYQAGHQAFSELMEGLVADGLVTYDTDAAAFSITEKGRAAVATP